MAARTGVAHIALAPLVLACACVPCRTVCAQRPPAYELRRQSIHDYNFAFHRPDAAYRNDIPTVTRIGTDYGLTAEGRDCAASEANTPRCFAWRPPGAIQASLPPGVSWCAAFHAVNGLCGNWHTGLRLDAAYPDIVAAACQPGIVGLYARVRAQAPATLRMELRWRESEPAQEGEGRHALYPCRPRADFEDVIWLGFDRDARPGSTVTDAQLRSAMRLSRSALDRNRRLGICTWALAGGGPIEVDDFGYLLAYPRMSLERRMFLSSFAKLARCAHPDFALVSDRAHFAPVSLTNACIEDVGARPVLQPDGQPIRRFEGFDNIPASGLYCLAAAAAADEGMASREAALALLRRTADTVARLRHAGTGILPHYARVVAGDAGRGWTYAPLSDSEFSTVDSALYFFGMLLAADLLGAPDVRARLLEAIAALDFAPLTDEAGYISHGLAADGVTPSHAGAPSTHPDAKVWMHWGGESALVVLLHETNRLLRRDRGLPAADRPARMDPPPAALVDRGGVYHGRGFIAEIQSLFFPQFDAPVPDALTGMVWPAMRRALLREQQTFFAAPAWAGTDAARLGLYGLSAGEIHLDLFDLPDVAGRDRHYLSFGSVAEDPRAPLPQDPRTGRVIHPHYILLSYLSGDTAQRARARAALETLEETGLFPPFGLVEAFASADVSKSLALFSSLNASFESLAAYHILVAAEGRPDRIHAAARANDVLARAMTVFYPGKEAAP